MKTFVCYTLRDGALNKKKLKFIFNYLNKYGPVFIDLINNDSNKKQARVIEELKSSDRVIVIETRETYNSEWVNLELALSRDLGIQILPIKCEDLIYTIKNNIPIFI